MNYQEAFQDHLIRDTDQVHVTRWKDDGRWRYEFKRTYLCDGEREWERIYSFDPKYDGELHELVMLLLEVIGIPEDQIEVEEFDQKGEDDK